MTDQENTAKFQQKRKRRSMYTCFPGHWLLPMPKSNRSIFLLTNVYYTIHSSLIHAMEASQRTAEGAEMVNFIKLT